MRGPAAAVPWGQVARFTLVGVVNTAVFYACYLPLHRALPYFAAYSAAFAVSLTGSFFLNTYFTYRTRPSWRKFLLFPLTQATNYAVQSAGLVALVSWLGMDSRAAPLAAALLALPVTFAVSRRILRPPARRTGPAAQPGAPPERSGEAA
ncbi:sugar transferase [Streptomyces sp. NRRL F-4489]|uniref:GtrA family protein n=1 Tax=Streptomyces sp. NRRL F-4489 TaxID=1609095 RepID=UPI0007464FC6|nr:GtrA family protein [Streptomyces sp. NRRL F-4489]KUL35649.1 sugar transferase [Streptomyces sp. NRRL F-4489]